MEASSINGDHDHHGGRSDGDGDGDHYDSNGHTIHNII
jgi:hypothetical protein